MAIDSLYLLFILRYRFIAGIHWARKVKEKILQADKFYFTFDP